MTEWRRSPTIALVAVVLFTVVQIAVPLRTIGNDAGPQRFGWQMYATARPSIEFTVHTPTGSERIELEDYMARVRLDLPLEELMPPHLCSVIPGAESVTWDDSVHTC